MSEQKEINVMLKFEGYFTKEQIDELPNDKTGLYLVFDYLVKDGVRYINRLVYIGKTDGTDSLRNRMSQHINGDYPKWKNKVGLEEDNFCFSYAIYEENDVANIEAALIYKYQPTINEDNKKHFNGITGHIEMFGAIDYLEPMTLINGAEIDYNNEKIKKDLKLKPF